MKTSSQCRLVAFAAASALATQSAFAAEPPACNSSTMLSHMRQAYQVWLLDTPKAKVTIEEVRETGYGPAAKGVNLYTPSKDYYNRSRYCQARIVVSTGQTDVGYFRADGLKNPDETDYNFAPCFKGHNTRGDGCVDERPPK